ncbi:formate/nitrite transporter family protein [Chitinolyticbacter albus]|uniref:formate/nitrite transporter family protein n=1 Tax=Chitinolyticbacter albus TaxID=2961951 RepID=UPI00210939B0|nr:formate/nitrite transporter family protein [Chitinolyticbacter albus]
MFDRNHVEKAANSGLSKLTLLQTDPRRYMLRAVLAGMYLTITVFTYWALVQNLQGSPWGKVVASLFFGVGLTIIVFTHTELFTSNTLYLTVSSAEGKTSWWQTAVLWCVCYLGNLAGVVVVAGLLLGAGAIDALPAGHALYEGAAHKAHQSAQLIFFKGILANWVVCLAVRLALRCKEDIAKIVIMLLVVFMFLYLGFEHSIANMGTFAISLLGQGSIGYADAWHNLLYSTLGNIVGGVVLLGLPFAYLNPDDMPAKRAAPD